MTENHDKSEHESPKPSSGSTKTIIAWLGGTFLIVAIITIGVFLGSREKPHVSHKDVAMRMCTTAIGLAVKSPATLQYAEKSVLAGEKADTYLVVGSFDSENSFGAMLRTQFSCGVSVSQDDATLTRISIDGAQLNDLAMAQIGARIQSKKADELIRKLQRGQ